MSATLNQLGDLLRKQMDTVEDNAAPRRQNLEGSREVDTDAMLKALNPDYVPEVAEGDQEQKMEQPEVAEDQATDSEVDQAAQAESEEAETADGESEQTEEALGTLTQLAEELGVDPAALYNLEIPMPNGEKSFKIGDIKNLWIDHLSKSETLDTEQQELASQREAYQQQLAQLAQFQQLPGELVQAEASYLKAENDYNSVDWVTLESTNPGQAALQRQKLDEARRLADQHRQYVANNLQLMQGQIQEQRKAEMQKHIQQRDVEMKILIPEWSDDTKQQAGRLELESFLANEGLPEDVYKGVLEYGHPALVRALKRLSEHNKAVEKLNQPKPLPKTLKPSTITQTPKGKQAVLDKLLKQAKSSPDQRFKADAVAALLRG